MPIRAVVVPVVVVLLYLFIPGVKERPWTAARILGAVVAVAGYLLVSLARIQLGKSFTVMPQARELVTSGLYSRLRHPIYVCADLMFFGLILALRIDWLFVVLAAMIAMQMFQGRREGRVLHARFGQAYVDYRNRTWF
jgi:protein-S-isoprenylcysteine O-methyltransferase Ste14